MAINKMFKYTESKKQPTKEYVRLLCKGEILFQPRSETGLTEKRPNILKSVLKSQTLQVKQPKEAGCTVSMGKQTYL